MALLTNSEWRDILCVLGLLLVLIAVYMRLRTLRFSYYTATAYEHPDESGGTFRVREYYRENSGKILRKNKSTGEWQVLRLWWQNEEYCMRWRALTKEHVSQIETFIEKQEPIKLYFN